MIITVVLLVILISTFYYMSLRRPFNGGSSLVGVSVGYYNYKSTGIDLYTDLGLNESTASKLSGASLALSITETTTNQSIYLDYIISNHHIIIFSFYRQYLMINHPIINYSYHVSFHFIINSSDTEVQNVNVIGLNNYFNLSFIITEEWNVKIKPDPDYSPLSNKIEETNRGGYIWFIGTPQCNSGHVYQILTDVVEYD